MGSGFLLSARPLLFLLRGVKCMEKLISVLSVVLVLVFSFALTSFADDSYSCDIVPDSPYIWGLQVTDNDSGSVVQSVGRKAVMKASSSSSTSSDSVYFFKDIVSFQGTGVTPNPDILPNVIERITVNGYRGYKFKQKSDEFYQKYNSFRTNPMTLSKLRATNKYHVTFTMQQSKNAGAYNLYLYDPVDPSRVISLAKQGYGGNIGVNASFDFYITIPETWTGAPTLRFEATQLKNSEVYYQIFINNLTFTDVTNENLDKALDKFGNRVDDIVNPSVPYEKFDDGSFKDSANELKEAENALPTVDFNAIDELANSVDVSSYAQAFASINQLFIRVVDTIGITPLIFFACFFGFCVFLIGRKLSGG